MLAFATAVPSLATVIDFEAQASNRGGNLTGIPDSPLTVGPATFTGGELLRGQIGLSPDTTGVYATQGLFGSGETNPLVIAFASPILDFSLLLLNDDNAGSYTVADDVGDSVTDKPLASTSDGGAILFALAGSGLTKVTITSANADAWGFSLDDVTFTSVPPTPVPEPKYVFLLGSGLLMVAVLRRRTGRRHQALRIKGIPVQIEKAVLCTVKDLAFASCALPGRSIQHPQGNRGVTLLQ